MRLLLLLVLATSAATRDIPKSSDPCKGVECRAGRECVVSGGVAQCLCVTECPDHDNPVCGTDGESYDNFCLLHQRACVTGYHNSIDYRGYCKKDIELAMKEFGITTMKPTTSTTSTTTTTSAPPVSEELSVCYGPQRDALRDAIIRQWQETVKQQPWYADSMTYRESLSGHFFSCDKDRDYGLRPDELIDCFARIPFLPRPEQDLTITRTLCIDALVEDVDANRDWRLDFQEFTHLLDPLYHPQTRNCSLEGKDYTDGAEVTVECNHCVCATGSWVCATHNCEHKTKVSDMDTLEGKFGYMDTKYDSDNNDLDDDLDDDDDDEYYDDEDYDDDGDSLEKFTNEEAKREFNLLSSADKKKLTHLEGNIKKFYNDFGKFKSTPSTQKKATAKVVETSSEESYSNESDEYDSSEEETSSEEEEDDLLDQYDDVLERSELLQKNLTSLRDSIRALEDKRARREHARHLEDSRYKVNGVHINSVQHGGKTSGASKKQQKYDEYRRVLKAKQDSKRRRSQTDNDIWEDQWKAKIKKHNQNALITNHL